MVSVCYDTSSNMPTTRYNCEAVREDESRLDPACALLERLGGAPEGASAP